MSAVRCINCNGAVQLDESVSRSDAGAGLRHLLKAAADVNLNDATPNGNADESSCGNNYSSTCDGSDSTLGATAKVQGELLEIICSDGAPLRQPMCADCADKLVESMDGHLRALEKECAEYRAVLKRLSDAQPATAQQSFDAAINERQLSKLRADEAALQAELRQLRDEENAIDEQIKRERHADEKLHTEEGKLWHQYRDLSRQLLDLDAEERSGRSELRHLKDQYERLSRTNALNTLFHIWPADHFGTINGFRLGRLPDEPVKWAEINTALGHAALLLQSLALLTGLTFRTYEPVPRGARSQIAVLPEDATRPQRHYWPLFYDGAGFKLALGQSKFDQALVAFVHCVGQLRDRIAEQKGVKSDCVLPHAMHGDKIVDGTTSYSVQLHLNSEERWTKAMKCMLFNLKFALAHVTAKTDE